MLETYGGSHVPLRVTDDLITRYRDCKMIQFLDLFSIPEATLFADVMEVRVHKFVYTCVCIYTMDMHVCY